MGFLDKFKKNTEEIENTQENENESNEFNEVDFTDEELKDNNENMDEDDEYDDEDEEELMLIDREDKEELSVQEQVEDIIEYFTQIKPTILRDLDKGRISRPTFESYVKDYITSKITRDEDKLAELMKEMGSFIFTYSILDELINDPTISDIKCYDYDHIRVKRLGHREDAPIKFANRKAYIRFVNRVAVKNKINISDQNALQNFTDTKSSDAARLRFNISTGFVNSSELPVLQVRKVNKRKMTREELIEAGFFTPEIADYLERRVTEGGGMLFTGQGGSGKTTAMNYLIDFVPDTMSGLVIQENDEMFSYTHKDMIFQHTVINNGESKIQYGLQDLARNGLLTDIDLFIIGEIKGAEATYLLNAVYTGAKGWASVHGASSTEAMNKLVDYIKYNSDYSQAEVFKMLVHLDTVIYMKKFKVVEIAEIERFDEATGQLIYKRIL